MTGVEDVNMPDPLRYASWEKDADQLCDSAAPCELLRSGSLENELGKFSSPFS